MLDKNTRNNVYNQTSPVCRFLYEAPESGGNLYSIAQKYDLHKDEAYKAFATTVGDIILGFYRIEDTVPLLQQELGLDPRTAALLGADVLDFLSPLSDPNWQPPLDEEDESEDILEQTQKETLLPNTYIETNENPSPVTPPPVSNNQPYTAPFNPEITPVQTPTPDIETQPPAIFTQSAPPVQNMPPQPPVNPALHTMATDMDSIRQSSVPRPTLNLEDTPTYMSQNQDSLRQPLSPVPEYTPSPNPDTPNPAQNIEPPRWSSS